MRILLSPWRGRCTLLLICLLFVGCTDDEASSELPPGADAKPSITTTIPPLGMILRPLVEGRAEVRVLLDPGQSPHTYEPTPSAVRELSGSLMLVHADEHLDGWVASLPAKQTVALVPLLPEAQRLQMPPAASKDHAHAEESNGGHEHGEVDPHFWTSPRAVHSLLPALVDTLCTADPGGCATYQMNADSLGTQLEALDVRISTMLKPVEGMHVGLSQPFFRYFLQRYGLHVAEIIEPRPAKEPSPQQLSRQIRQLQGADVRVIFTQAQLPDRSARAVADAAEIATVNLDPIGGVEGRASYAELLEYNATQILNALGPEPTSSPSR
ncbi:hypothetical protein CRI94_05250 [Longibacter salinarum]|uniref:Zinc ABC transporter substrate-binding protein n=1 Tax=Longibacter salinarum TaxID=1850348 RepID=A0A2A8D0L8_9BACT|nr:metal ABC transporter substrate-binding protein [Longibacter salinarum]PEN14434.1 hypothetical protein CRI94_05250 [Longibacter salinarum]